MSDTVALLCQADITSTETRLASHHAMMVDRPLVRSTYESLALHAEPLQHGRMLPIGSVEFVRKAMLIAGLNEPDNLSYPEVLRGHLHRKVKRIRAGLVADRCFIKPVTTKAFTGFVYDPELDAAEYSAHDREQYETFILYPSECALWMSEPVQWLSEHRYYVVSGAILGSGRYDDGEDKAPEPDWRIVSEMALAMAKSPNAPAAFGLDVGVLSTGETALVEVNDAWALGYYQGTLHQENYFAMLDARWRQLSSMAKD